MHLRAGDCVEAIHKKTRKRRCRFSVLPWSAGVHHLSKGVKQLNMNYFEYLPGIQRVWGMKFTFAAVQNVTDTVSADG